MRLTALLLLVLAGMTTLSAQAVVDPGMSRAQVIARLGAPSVERTADSAMFLFYPNGLERRVGMSDVVVLVNDKVVDAVFRSPKRRYSAQSSSPAAIPADVARKQLPTAPPALQAPPALAAPAKKP